VKDFVEELKEITGASDISVLTQGRPKKTVYHIFLPNAQRAGAITTLLDHNPKWKRKTNGSGILKSSKGYIEISPTEFIVMKIEVTSTRLPQNVLKPDKFGLTQPLKYPKYVETLQGNTNELKLGMTGSYCSMLISHQLGKIPNSTLVDFFKEHRKNIDIASVMKDFGECLGPIAIVENDMFATIGKVANKYSIVEFPKRPNEPLLDYIIESTGVINVSAKTAAKHTNTVKGSDLLSMLDKKSKWFNDPMTNIIREIESNTAWVGPIKAGEYLKEMKFKEFKTFDSSWVQKNARKDELIPYAAMKWIESVDPSKIDFWNKGITTIGLSQVVGQLIETYSKTDPRLDFRPFISDALSSDLVYVKLDIGATGIPKWEVLTGKDLLNNMSSSRVYLRSKSYQVRGSLDGRAADKMGFQL
jgi:hypothetical protein